MTWNRSSHCLKESCIEIAVDPDEALIRDSEKPDGPYLHLTFDDYKKLLAVLKATPR